MWKAPATPSARGRRQRPHREPPRAGAGAGVAGPRGAGRSAAGRRRADAVGSGAAPRGGAAGPRRGPGAALEHPPRSGRMHEALAGAKKAVTSIDRLGGLEEGEVLVRLALVDAQAATGDRARATRHHRVRPASGSSRAPRASATRPRAAPSRARARARARSRSRPAWAQYRPRFPASRCGFRRPSG